MLVDVAQLERDYNTCQPDVDDPNQLVSFGTSGHRGSFPETHILAITQAVCDYCRTGEANCPIGKDMEAAS
jgi:phosphoglucomutase